MNISCSICNDLFTPSSDTCSTYCGHLFHHICLIQWIERSRTCPQCRNKTTEKTIHKVYLNLANTDAIQDDATTLQLKYDNLLFQLKLKDMDIKNANEKLSKATAQNIGLRDEVKELEREIATAKSVVHAHKEQINYFKARSKERDKLADEVQKLKEQLKNIEHVQLAITGTKNQVEDMLRQNRDPQSLAILVASLKKELIEADRRKKQIHGLLKEAQAEASRLRKETAELNKELQQLRQEVKSYKDNEAERQYLKEKLKQLVCNKKKESSDESTKSLENDKSLQRIVQESPAPLPKQPRFSLRKDSLESESKESPAIKDKVKAINNSDSPYLAIKSSSLGIPNFIDMTRSHPKATNKYSIFKSHSAPAHEMKEPQGCYDGMGGYMKDEIFPSSRRDGKLSLGVKRHRSVSSTSNAKLRKLGPIKKMDDFLK